MVFEYACVGVCFGIACRGHKMCYLSRCTELGSGFCVCCSFSYVVEISCDRNLVRLNLTEE